MLLSNVLSNPQCHLINTDHKSHQSNQLDHLCTQPARYGEREGSGEESEEPAARVEVRVDCLSFKHLCSQIPTNLAEISNIGSFAIIFIEPTCDWK